jgi:hypothetical protein
MLQPGAIKTGKAKEAGKYLKYEKYRYGGDVILPDIKYNIP